MDAHGGPVLIRKKVQFQRGHWFSKFATNE